MEPENSQTDKSVGELLDETARKMLTSILSGQVEADNLPEITKAFAEIAKYNEAKKKSDPPDAPQRTRFDDLREQFHGADVGASGRRATRTKTAKANGPSDSAEPVEH